MRFGCYLVDRGVVATPENRRATAVLADNLGYDCICMEDHIVAPSEVTSTYPYTSTGRWPPDTLNFYELLTTLSYLAAITHRVKLLTHVLVLPYRNPVYTAKIIATIDQLSGGRMIVGVGAGWMEDEFKILGHTYFAHRGTVTSEYIRIFKELWTKDDPQFQGKYYQLSGVRFSPPPLQKPHPPIWVGGRVDAAIRRAARLGDVWFPTGFRRPEGLEATEPLGPELIKTRTAYLDQEVVKAGREPGSVGVGFTTDVAFTDGQPGRTRRTFEGSPEEIAGDFRQYVEAGVKHFVVTFRCASISLNMESMERFAREVRPLVDGR